MTISQFRKYSAVPPKQRLCPGVGQNKLGSSRGCAKHGCVLWVIKEHKVHLQLGWGHGLCGTDVDTGKAEPGQRQLPAAVVFMEFDIQVEITRVEEEKSSKVHRVFGWLYGVDVEGVGAHEGDGILQLVVVHPILVILVGHHGQSKGPHAVLAPVGQLHLQGDRVPHLAGHHDVAVTDLAINQDVPLERSQLQMLQDQLIQNPFHTRFPFTLQGRNFPANIQLAVNLQTSCLLPFFFQLLCIRQLCPISWGFWEALKIELVHLDSHALTLPGVQN